MRFEATKGSPLRDVRAKRPSLLVPRSALRFVRRAASVTSLVFLDVAGLALGIYAALVLRELYLGKGTPLWGLLWEAEADWLPFVTLVTVLVFWQRGLYAEREQRAGFGAVLSSIVLVAVLTVAFAAGSGHEFGSYLFAPTAVALTAVFVGLLRSSYEVVSGILLRAAGIRRRAVLVGAGEELERLHAALASSQGAIEYELVGAIGAPPEGAATLPAILASGRVDEVVIADSDLPERQLLDIVEEAHGRGVRVRVAPKTTEILLERAEYVPGVGVPLFELRPPVLAGTDWVVKRAFDLAVSVVLLAVGLPVWLAIALAIKLTSPGPVLYADRRIGLGEREFAMLKFRTMFVDAPRRQAELEEANQADGALFKIREDPRVTPVGRALRRFSLDEIPQLLNVLRGEMSLVGPRPLPMRDFERLEAWHRKRYLVLPGMTGLWQISGRSNLGFDDLVRLDFYYLENWSIWLDIAILMKTIPAVVTRRGAY